jgi:hypothetical protein
LYKATTISFTGPKKGRHSDATVLRFVRDACEGVAYHTAGYATQGRRNCQIAQRLSAKEIPDDFHEKLLSS